MMLRKKAAQPALIGRSARVVSSANASLIGLSGRIVDETKETLTIETQGRTRHVLKGAVKLEVEGVLVDGKDLKRRPEDR